jgi:hypothetical protein
MGETVCYINIEALLKCCKKKKKYI